MYPTRIRDFYMANFNPGTQKWETSSGTGSFDSRQQAMAWENAHGKNHESFEDGVMGGIGDVIGNIAGSVIGFILKIIPYLIGFLLGSLIAVILKLKIVGKIILTAFTVSCVLSLLAILTPNILALQIAAYVVAILAGAWFWFYHYNALLKLSGSYWIYISIKTALICFTGPLICGVIYLGYFLLAMGGAVKGTYLSEAIAWGFIIGIPAVIAVIYWFRKIYKGEEEDMSDVFKGDVGPTIKKTKSVSNTKTKQASANCKTSDSEQSGIISDTVDSGNSFSNGEYVWARWKDGAYYYAQITDCSSPKIKVLFYDGYKREVSCEDVFYLDDAIKSGLVPQGNWKGWNVLYPCKILDLRKDTVKIEYTEDGTIEEVAYKVLAFKKKKK